MAFCSNCGAKLDDNAEFCSSCGTRVQKKAENVNPQQAYSNQSYQNQNAQQAQPLDADVQNNKVMAVLAYIGLLVLIPIFAAKDSKFARFHSGQGLTLMIFSVAYWILQLIINAIVGTIFPPTWSGVPSVVASLVSAILSLGGIFFLVLAIIGIVNAAKGTFTKLPILGQIDFISKHFEK